MIILFVNCFLEC